MRSGVEHLLASNPEATGHIVLLRAQPLHPWPSVPPLERKAVRRLIVVEWEQARLPALGEAWWR